MQRKFLAISNHADMLGGGEHSFLDFISNLPHNWRALAVTPNDGELTSRLRQNKIQTFIIPLSSMKPWYIIRILANLQSYFRLCRRYHPVLIYANGPRAVFYGGIVGRLQHIPVLWHCRISNPDIYLDFILRRLSTKIIANSEITAQRFGTPLDSKIKVIYNGLDLRRLKDESVAIPSQVDPKWKVILVVARASRWKRHDVALKAFEQVAAKDPNAHLVCVGAMDELESDWWKHLQEKSHQSMFSNRIHWIGQVSDVRPWYRAASVLLLCSENEPFGRVIVEAMASGVPVVATRSGGVPEIVRDRIDGILVTPGSSEEIAASIELLLKDKELTCRYTISAEKRSRSFSLETHIAEMIALMDDLI